ncbi:MAG: outer membrane beta-barrel protein, partial [Symploca sp. SIO1B1]|nr:outer membrane beta-barrel protein [Symploca sp. SIO1B1]
NYLNNITPLYVAGYPAQDSSPGYKLARVLFSSKQPEVSYQFTYSPINDGNKRLSLDDLEGGMSGGPIFNQEAELVGIHAGRTLGEDPDGLGVPITVLEDAIAANPEWGINLTYSEDPEQRFSCVNRKGEKFVLKEFDWVRDGEYFAFGVGAAIPNYRDTDSDPGIKIGYAMGMDNQKWRWELESFLGIENNFPLSWAQLSVMGNVYYEPITKNKVFDPYVGVGIGASSFYSDPLDISPQSINLAFQAKVGNTFRVSPTSDVFVQYRYQNLVTLEDVSTHMFEFGYRFHDIGQK